VYAEGIERLQSLETATPNSAEIHYELSLAYQRTGRVKDADRETTLYQSHKKQD
jgi:Flp pilus assembly protein TadD